MLNFTKKKKSDATLSPENHLFYSTFIEELEAFIVWSLLLGQIPISLSDFYSYFNVQNL